MKALLSKMFLGEDISESFGCWEIHVARRGWVDFTVFICIYNETNRTARAQTHVIHSFEVICLSMFIKIETFTSGSYNGDISLWALGIMYWMLAKTCLFVDVYILLLLLQRNVRRNQICKSCNKSLTSLTPKLRNLSQLLSMQLTPLLSLCISSQQWTDTLGHKR